MDPNISFIGVLLDLPDAEINRPIRLGRKYRLVIRGLDQRRFLNSLNEPTEPLWLQDLVITLFSLTVRFEKDRFSLLRQPGNTLPECDTQIELLEPNTAINVMVLTLPEKVEVQTFMVILSGSRTFAAHN